MVGVTRGKTLVAMLIAALVLGACGGGDGDGGSTATIEGDQVVVDPDAVAAAREQIENDDEAEPLRADEVEDSADSGEGGSGAGGSGAGATAEDEADDGIEVAEAEEDEIDGLLNSLTLFNQCLADEGYEFIGAPGFGGTTEEFEPDYLAALGACATESDILAASEGFADAQANLSPEEIELNNLGLPVFRDCMIRLGWEVGELVPDERGALGFDTSDGGFGLTPPGGGGLADFSADDIDECRREAEQFVADNADIDG